MIITITENVFYLYQLLVVRVAIYVASLGYQKNVYHDKFLCLSA